MPFKHIYYECTCCDTIYEREIDALMCEERHLLEGKDDNYSCYDLCRIYNLIESRGSDPCDYCKHSYYVYGCEQECSFRNNGECFSCGSTKGKRFEPKPIDIVKKFIKDRKEEKSNDIQW